MCPTALVGQGFQVTHQRRASTVELIQTLGSLAKRDDVLHRLLVQTAIRVSRSQPLASGSGVARRQIAAHSDDSQRARLHQCGLTVSCDSPGAQDLHQSSAKDADDSLQEYDKQVFIGSFTQETLLDSQCFRHSSV